MSIIQVNEVKANKATASYGILFLFLTILGVFMVAYPIYTGEGYGKINYMMIAGVLMAPFGFVGFLRSCYISSFYFDIENERCKQVDGYGPFKWGEWKTIGTIEYVSVFRQFYADQEAYDEEKEISIAYDINLWNSDDCYVTITSYQDKMSALRFAQRLAIQLNIRMLDSTTPNDYVWVELDDQKE